VVIQRRVKREKSVAMGQSKADPTARSATTLLDRSMALPRANRVSDSID
jgi:hypothetical protein